MHILCLGLNHQTADICLREKLAFSNGSAKAALARLGCGNGSLPGMITEMVILSTCNRVEIYAVSPVESFAELEDFLADVRGVVLEEFKAHLYELLDGEAVAHLFRVAAGLDSLVIGEPQILGQVMEAFEESRSQGAAGPVISRLFQAALHTGKRARSETAIGQNPASISSVAVYMAEQTTREISNAQVAVLGAGEMAELAVEALRKRGATRIWVINRTLARARSLADRWQGQAGTFEKLAEVLRSTDILITSTGAPHTLIHTDMVSEAMARRSERPLVIIDIAVPRDVDVEVGELAGVSLFDIDTLQQHLESSLARRAGEIPRVESILEEEELAFMEYIERLDVLPLIAEMRQQAELIRIAELDKTLRKLPDLTQAERQRLEALTQALVKKILHHPITLLREEAGSPNAAEYAAAARTLFGLEARYSQHSSDFARRSP